MIVSIRCLLAAMIAVGLATPVARADDKDQLKASIKGLQTALANGDARTAKGYVVYEEGNQKLIDALTKLVKWSKELQKAVVAQFGKDGKDLSEIARITGENLPFIPRLADLDESQIAVHGDTATVPPKPHTYTLAATFKKEGGTWKLQPQSDPKRALQAASSVDSIANVLLELTGEIKRGQYSTAKQARRAYMDKLATSIRNSSGTGR